jgi:hypothetical protein
MVYYELVIVLEFMLFTLISTIFILYILKNEILISTSAMAAIMSFGIIIYGVLPHFFGNAFLHSTVAKGLVVVVSALWLSFCFSIFLSMWKKQWKELHYVHPVNRFGIGTWIAATSIVSILCMHYFPEAQPIITGLTILNVLVWVFYCYISTRAIAIILKSQKLKNIHGILLLMTVSTQSLVMLIHTSFPTVPRIITTSLFIIGIGFYLVNISLLLKRYLTENWSFETDWNNTNCIIHGALSITGMASIVSGIAHIPTLFIFWNMTLIIFLIIEAIEFYRLFRLVKQFGWKRSIGTYDVTQWSRIFTFSMFYTFTVTLPAVNEAFAMMQMVVTQIGFVIILALVVYEIGLVLHHQFQNKPKKKSRSEAA